MPNAFSPSLSRGPARLPLTLRPQGSETVDPGVQSCRAVVHRASSGHNTVEPWKAAFIQAVG